MNPVAPSAAPSPTGSPPAKGPNTWADVGYLFSMKHILNVILAMVHAATKLSTSDYDANVTNGNIVLATNNTGISLTNWYNGQINTLINLGQNANGTEQQQYASELQALTTQSGAVGGNVSAVVNPAQSNMSAFASAASQAVTSTEQNVQAALSKLVAIV